MKAAASTEIARTTAVRDSPQPCDPRPTFSHAASNTPPQLASLRCAQSRASQPLPLSHPHLNPSAPRPLPPHKPQGVWPAWLPDLWWEPDAPRPKGAPCGVCLEDVPASARAYRCCGCPGVFHTDCLPGAGSVRPGALD